MRYFLHVFVLIFSLFSFVVGANAQSEWEKIRIAFNEAMGKEGGASTPIETEFGDIRLVSCRTGVKDLSGLSVGVEVALKPDWILKEIKIEPVADGIKADVYPIFQENRTIQQSWTTNYKNPTIFPIWLYNMNNKDVPLTVLGEFEACSTNTYRCVKTKQFLNLYLPAGEAYPTLSCGAIQYSLKNAAVDIQKTNVQAENQLLANGDLKVRIVFPKNVEKVDIQSPDIPLKQTFQKIDRFVFSGIFHPENPLKVGDRIPFNIRSSNGCFTWNLVVADKDLSPIQMPLPFGFGFWSGLLFFFLSPLWCIWMMPNRITDDPNIFRKKIRILQLVAIIAILGLGLCWMVGFYPFGWIQNQIVAGIVLIGLVALLIRPVPKQLWVIGILIFLLPKPFGGILNEVALSTKIYLLIWWWICALIPFNIWLLAPKFILNFFKGVQAQNVPAYVVVIRLPYLILIGWIGLSLIGYHYYKSDPIFKPEETKGPAIVQVVNPVCLTCVKDRLFFLSNFKNHLYRIDYKSNWSNEKRRLYQITGDTFYIYINENGEEILIPQNLTRHKLNKLLE